MSRPNRSRRQSACPPPFLELADTARGWIGAELAAAIAGPETDLSGAAIAAGRMMRGCPGIGAAGLRRLREWVERAWRVEAVELVAEASEPAVDDALDLFRAFAAKNRAVRAKWPAGRLGPPAAGDLPDGWGWPALLLRDDVESIRVVVALAAGVAGPDSPLASTLERLDEYVRPLDEAGTAAAEPLLPLLADSKPPAPIDWLPDLVALDPTPWWLATAALVLPVAAPLPADRMLPVLERWNEVLRRRGFLPATRDPARREPYRNAPAATSQAREPGTRRPGPLTVVQPAPPDYEPLPAAADSPAPSTGSRVTWRPVGEEWWAFVDWPAPHLAGDDAAVRLHLRRLPPATSAVTVYGLKVAIRVRKDASATVRYRLGDIREAIEKGGSATLLVTVGRRTRRADPEPAS